MLASRRLPGLWGCRKRRKDAIESSSRPQMGHNQEIWLAFSPLTVYDFQYTSSTVISRFVATLVARCGCANSLGWGFSLLRRPFEANIVAGKSLRSEL